MADIVKVVGETQVARDQIPGADLITVKRDFTDAYWTKTATAEKDVGIAPDGAFTAGRLTDTTSASTQYAYRDLTTTVQPYLASIDVRTETAAGSERVELWVRGIGGGGTDSMTLRASLASGEIETLTSGGDVIYGDVLKGVGQGYHRLRLFFSSKGGDVRFEIHPPNESSMLIVDAALVPLPYVTPYTAAYTTFSARQRIARAGTQNGKVSGVGVLTDDKEIE